MLAFELINRIIITFTNQQAKEVTQEAETKRKKKKKKESNKFYWWHYLKSKVSARRCPPAPQGRGARGGPKALGRPRAGRRPPSPRRAEGSPRVLRPPPPRHVSYFSPQAGREEEAGGEVPPPAPLPVRQVAARGRETAVPCCHLQATAAHFSQGGAAGPGPEDLTEPGRPRSLPASLFLIIIIIYLFNFY